VISTPGNTASRRLSTLAAVLCPSRQAVGYGREIFPDVRNSVKTLAAKAAPTGVSAILLLACTSAHALDLVQGYRLALQNDAFYQAALAANRAGQEALPQARAQLMPNLSASGTRSKLDRRRDHGFERPGQPQLRIQGHQRRRQRAPAPVP
jgi:outer membrane protein TolC